MCLINFPFFIGQHFPGCFFAFRKKNLEHNFYNWRFSGKILGTLKFHYPAANQHDELTRICINTIRYDAHRYDDERVMHV